MIIPKQTEQYTDHREARIKKPKCIKTHLPQLNFGKSLSLQTIDYANNHTFHSIMKQLHLKDESDQRCPYGVNTVRELREQHKEAIPSDCSLTHSLHLPLLSSTEMPQVRSE